MARANIRAEKRRSKPDLNSSRFSPGEHSRALPLAMRPALGLTAYTNGPREWFLHKPEVVQSGHAFSIHPPNRCRGRRASKELRG